jgi:nucleoside-diphosphate-sugar epimerase
MKVFLTGASGRIGSRIIPHLVARGHTVTGLVRSQTSATTIEKLGATALIGTLADTDKLKKAAQESDAVIHTAMDHTKGFSEEVFLEERAVIEAFAVELEDTNKVLIASGGTAGLPEGADETTPSPGFPGAFGIRVETFNKLLGYKSRGIRSILVRLAMNTHSNEQMHGFEAMLLGASKQIGVIPYAGENRWSACHADDAALLYVLAMEKAEAGTAVHAVSEFVRVKDIAEVLSKKTGTPAGLVEKDKLGQLGVLAMLLQVDQNLSTEWTRKTFGWDPKGQALLPELEEGSESYYA